MRSRLYQCGGFTELLSLLQDFLNDYGLIWVGDTDSGDPAERGRSTSPADLQSLRVFCMLKLCWFCFVVFCRDFWWQRLPHKLWSRAAEDQRTERPPRGRRVFCANDSDRSTAGKKGSHSTEALQEWHRNVWWSFPLISGAQHPG